MRVQIIKATPPYVMENKTRNRVRQYDSNMKNRLPNDYNRKY